MRLRDNITLQETEDSQVYRFDEVVFELQADSGITTTEEIEANFSDWWTYGSQPEEAIPSLEERVAMLEEVILAM